MAKKEASAPKKEVKEKEAAAPKSLTKNQLITLLAEKSDLPKKKVAELLTILLETAYKEAKKANGFVFPGLGKLVISKRAARTIKNPQTQEPMKVPAKKVLKFRILKAAKDAVLGAAKK
ncbi:HU family DNA-binding protein [bacterium]|nr:HU family DNA-binding protein [bacterium]